MKKILLTNVILFFVHIWAGVGGGGVVIEEKLIEHISRRTFVSWVPISKYLYYRLFSCHVYNIP